MQINWDELIYRFRLQIGLILIGLIAIGGGALLFKSVPSTPEVQVLSKESVDDEAMYIVEISGSVNRPGVYELPAGARVEDVLGMAEGFADDANVDYVSKVLNRAAKIIDGQKIYIPSVDEQSSGSSANSLGGDQSGSSSYNSNISKLININTASAKELESLWGIGPVTAQNVIEHRMYSTVEELLSKKILKTNVYNRNKDLMTVY